MERENSTLSLYSAPPSKGLNYESAARFNKGALLIMVVRDKNEIMGNQRRLL